MTLRVAFLHAARRDFEDAAVWYEERRSGLSAEFRAEVDAAVALAAPHDAGSCVGHQCGSVRTTPPAGEDLPLVR